MDLSRLKPSFLWNHISSLYTTALLSWSDKRQRRAFFIRFFFFLLLLFRSGIVISQLYSEE